MLSRVVVDDDVVVDAVVDVNVDVDDDDDVVDGDVARCC